MSRKRKFLLCAVIICFFICFVPVAISAFFIYERSQYADFSMYSTADAAKEAMLIQLNVGSTTREEVIAFLRDSNIRKCVNNETSIRCSALSPLKYNSNSGNFLTDLVNEAIVIYTYEFIFHFDNNILIDIRAIDSVIAP